MHGLRATMLGSAGGCAWVGREKQSRTVSSTGLAQIRVKCHASHPSTAGYAMGWLQLPVSRKELTVISWLGRVHSPEHNTVHTLSHSISPSCSLPSMTSTGSTVQHPRSIRISRPEMLQPKASDARPHSSLPLPLRRRRLVTRIHVGTPPQHR